MFFHEIDDEKEGELLSRRSFASFFVKFTNEKIFTVFQAAMMSLAYKEGLQIPPPALNEVILASNQDVRQVSHCY